MSTLKENFLVIFPKVESIWKVRKILVNIFSCAFLRHCEVGKICILKRPEGKKNFFKNFHLSLSTAILCRVILILKAKRHYIIKIFKDLAKISHYCEEELKQKFVEEKKTFLLYVQPAKGGQTKLIFKVICII